ncbi:Retrovirus-related Pol polyprotein from transposon TNT 1-94 [Vitis vinifera]|uniref:Retrovirus-related Pol polyprotein from transposon TNT 1-94 n=1 Tax=Vitis vinifera TaxID=29760 RepID=A0A438FNC5_VITVI|nr:Retrovirus-related Pol polyprotein from transposon TNT 1-94 [Vitis vinifera]
MVEEAGKASGIEKFDGTDFAYWRMQIEDYLYGRKLHLPLLGTKPESMKAEEWALLDRQVLGVIRLTLSRSVAHNVVKEKTTADLMKALSGMYEKPSANNKVHLMKKLFNLKMAENASVAQHLNECNTITNQLSSVEIDFDDEIRALIVLASLPNSWEAMRMAVSNSTGKEKLKYNDIRDLILAEEIRRRDAGETSGSGSALNLETRGRGHFKRQCKSPKKKNEDDSANAVTEEVQDALLLAVDTLDVVGLGDVRISLPNGSVWLLEKVRHIPDLKRNLISVGQLDDEGHAILFVGGTWKVTKGARTGHMSEKGMKMLLSKGKLPELKSIDFDMCESCILGKQKKIMGGEYIDGGFSEYCAATGIRMEKTIPGTPQQNALQSYLINEDHQFPWSSDFLRRFGAVNCNVRCYRDRSKESEFVNLDELTESTVQKGGEEDKENVNSQVDLSTPIVEVRRSSRNTRPPQRYSPVLNYLLLTDGGEPECYDEALQDENSSKWELAMKDEMDSLLGNQTWQLTELPVGKKALHNKWVYRIKNEHDGSKRYKARLVVKGFQQKEGIDYTEIFSPVVKMSTIRLVLGMVAAENLHLEQLDVKTAFLHGDLEEDLYMIQPEGFIVQGQENLVCKLRKSLYGLKQAPRQWYKKFDNFMHRIGSRDVNLIIVAMLRSDIEKINNLKKQLSKQFAMKDLGAAKQILAKPVSTPLGSHFKLSKEQSPKTEEERDHMSKVPYASAIGSLMYAMVCTRPDIAHAVGVVSRFMSRPGSSIGRQSSGF